jgi:hypothetical protein
MLHYLRRILVVTNKFSQALQRKDQDIENAISLLKTSKEQFKMMRENDWESLLEEVSSFLHQTWYWYSKHGWWVQVSWAFKAKISRDYKPTPFPLWIV